MMAKSTLMIMKLSRAIGGSTMLASTAIVFSPVRSSKDRESDE
jgi:hypothetical protein